jgi:WD40 repeat protein
MTTLTSILIRLVCLASLALATTAQAQSECSHYALVSGYYTNVHIYDGCSGAFLRLLDPVTGRINGAQAVRVGPDGMLWVVSENNAKVHRYRSDDFSYVDSPINVGINFGLTGIAFRGNDTVYAAGYTASTVRIYGLDGQLRSTPVPSNAGLRGPDNGMSFGPDGLLYVPGYDTSNILRHDPATGQNSILVPAGGLALLNTRGILFRPDGNTFLVTSEGGGRVIEYRRDNGAQVRELITGLNRPTGMDWGPDGSLVVVTNSGVFRFDPATGASRGVLIPAGSGSLSGPTYVRFLPKTQALDRSQIGTQFWISGAGPLTERRLVVDLLSTTGPLFGADFDPNDAQSKRWGRIEVEFTGCTTAVMHWDSSGENSAGFGTGSYPLNRLLPGTGAQRCVADGFANSPPEDWLAGVWNGGAARSGEGFVFEYFNAATVVAAWFTHRPAD